MDAVSDYSTHMAIVSHGHFAVGWLLTQPKLVCTDLASQNLINMAFTFRFQPNIIKVNLLKRIKKETLL